MKGFGIGLIGAGIALCVRGVGFLRMMRKAERSPWSAEERAAADAALRHRFVFNRSAAADRVRMEDDPSHGRRLVAVSGLLGVVCLVAGAMIFALA